MAIYVLFLNPPQGRGGAKSFKGKGEGEENIILEKCAEFKDI